jgi:hypothetical protein
MKKWSLPTEKVGKRSDKSEIIPNFTAERKFQHGSFHEDSKNDGGKRPYPWG